MIDGLRSYFSNIHSYTWKNKNNRNILLFILAAILIAATNCFGIWEKPPHKGWVLVSLIVTLAYSCYFFISGQKHGWFDELGGKFSAYIILIHIPLLLITCLICNEYLDWFTYTPTTLDTLVLMAVFSFIFSLVNWLISERFKTVASNEQEVCIKKKLSELSGNFYKGVFMSDFPSAVVFFILFLYALAMPKPMSEQMEYFFSGAIAFQMLASNFIWVFNDDIIYSKIRE